MPKIELKDEQVTINYEVRGEGKPLILVHGLGFTSKDTWTYQMDAFSEEYELYAMDLRGFGESDNPQKKFSVQQHAYDLYSFMEEINIEKAILAGFSMGGWIAQQFIHDHPEMVEVLILSNTTSCLRPEGAEKFLKRADKVEGKKMEEIVEEQVSSTFTEETEKNNPEIIRFYRENFLKNNPVSYAKMFRALTATNFTPQLGRIKCPVLVTCGGEDHGITRGNTPTDAAEVIHSAIPQSSLHVIEGAGHYPHIEKSEEYNRLVLSFLKETLKGE